MISDEDSGPHPTDHVISDEESVARPTDHMISDKESVARPTDHMISDEKSGACPTDDEVVQRASDGPRIPVKESSTSNGDEVLGAIPITDSGCRTPTTPSTSHTGQRVQSVAGKKRGEFLSLMYNNLLRIGQPLTDHQYCAAEDRYVRIKKPRYIGDVRTPHVATPRRAKRCLEMSRRIIFQQRGKIEKLTRSLRNAKQKIENMAHLITHLKKNCLLSENSANNLMVCSYIISGTFNTRQLRSN